MQPQGKHLTVNYWEVASVLPCYNAEPIRHMTYLEFLKLVRLIELFGHSLSQKGIKLMALKNTAPRPLHHIPVNTQNSVQKL